MLTKKRKNLIIRNIKLYPWHYLFRGCIPSTPIAILYFAEVTNSYAAATSIFALHFIAIALFEIPCGVFSDQYLGRKRTIIAANLTRLAAFIIFPLAAITGGYQLLLIGALMMGLSDALFSGTEESLLYESVSEAKKEKIFHEIFGRCRSIMQLGMVIGTLLGFGIAYIFSLQTAMWVTIFFGIAGLVVDLFLVKPKSNVLDRTAMHLQIKQAFALMKSNRLIKDIATARLLNYSAGEVLYRFEVAFFYTLVPLWAIGIARIERQALGIISFWFSGSLISKFSFRKVLPWSAAGDIASRFTGLCLNNVLTPFLLPLSNLFLGTEMTASDTLLQREFKDSLRATVLSLISLGVNIISALLYLFVGFLADLTNPLTAMFFALGFKALAVPLYFRIASWLRV